MAERRDLLVRFDWALRRQLPQQDNWGVNTTVGRNETAMLRVAAGDPALPIYLSEKDLKIPDTIIVNGSEINVSDYKLYVVSGNSMSPKKIKDGYYLLVKENPEGYKGGDFIIVSVDKEYYKIYNPKTALYDFKLRYAIMEVSPSMTTADIIASIKDKHFEIILEENQRKLENKYGKARKAYPNEQLMLSITYHDGVLCYSFHPVRLIVGKAFFKLHHVNGELKSTSL